MGEDSLIARVCMLAADLKRTISFWTEQRISASVGVDVRASIDKTRQSLSENEVSGSALYHPRLGSFYANVDLSKPEHLYAEGFKSAVEIVCPIDTVWLIPQKDRLLIDICRGASQWPYDIRAYFDKGILTDIDPCVMLEDCPILNPKNFLKLKMPLDNAAKWMLNRWHYIERSEGVVSYSDVRKDIA